MSRDDMRLGHLQENVAGAEVGGELSYRAAMSLLRGQVHEAQENRIQAVRWYRDALRTDPFCYEAFKASPFCTSLAAQRMYRHTLESLLEPAFGRAGYLARLCQGVFLCLQSPSYPW